MVSKRQGSKPVSSPQQDLNKIGSRLRIMFPYLSAIMLWASFAPLGWAMLAWLAPLGWLAFSGQKTKLSRSDYLHLWLSGCVFWLATLQGVRLAFWPLYFGWVAISLYLAVYIPLFVASMRILGSRGLPLFLAAPVAWVGWEMARSYFLTGFSANTLAHSQVRFPVIIQVADQLGGYGVSFLIVLVNAGIYEGILAYRNNRRASLSPQSGRTANSGDLEDTNAALLPPALRNRWVRVPLIAVFLFSGNLGYGLWRLQQANRIHAGQEPLLTALLVQENTPTMFDGGSQNPKLAWTRYLDTTRALAKEHGVPDLVVWPESTFSAGAPWVDPSARPTLPNSPDGRPLPFQSVDNWMQDLKSEFEFKAQLVLDAFERKPNEESKAGLAESKPYLLLGADALDVTTDPWMRFNSALLVGPNATVEGRYDKMHLVMFGEYIPLGPLLQWLRDLFGLGGLGVGDGPKCFRVAGSGIAPNICFESMMPRLIRWQVACLAKEGSKPDVLVNVSNDSWFRGSAILDHHLACTILCAVENRRPILVAANTGLSADIDGSGRLLQVSDRFAVAGLWAEPRADGRWGLVQSAGYPLGWLCLLMTLWAVTFGWQKRGPKPPKTH